MRVVKSPEERKEELLDAAEKLFMTKGYQSTTVRDILHEVNGSQGMFYHYFASKDDIFNAMVDCYINSYLVDMKAILSNNEKTFTNRLSLAIKKFCDTFNNSVSWKNELLDTPIGTEFLSSLKHKILQRLVDPLKVLIDDGIKAGMLKKEAIVGEDTYSAATYVLHGMYGIVNMHVLPNSTDMVDDNIIKLLVTYTLRTLGVSEEMTKFMLMEIIQQS